MIFKFAKKSRSFVVSFAFRDVEEKKPLALIYLVNQPEIEAGVHR
jgi:hypothetical protein